MRLKDNAAFEVDCNTSKGKVTVRVIAASKDTAHEEAIRVLSGDVIEVLEVRDAPELVAEQGYSVTENDVVIDSGMSLATAEDMRNRLFLQDQEGHRYEVVPDRVEATGDDPIVDPEDLEAAAELTAGLVHDDMVEVFFEPCSQCNAELSGPLRLFPRESIPLYINCFHCHAGQGKPIEEQIAYGLGMRARPLVQETELTANAQS